MTLRARLLVAMGVIALVLIGAAIAVTRLTRENLVDRVDEQLAASIDRARPDFGGGGGPGGPGRGDGFSSLYVAWIDGEGDMTPLVVPQGGELATPDVDAADALQRAGGRTAFTTGGVDADGDPADTNFRVLVADLLSDGAVLFALPLDEVDDSISRLVALEVVITASILTVLGLVGWWIVRLGIRPVKQMATAASAIGAGDLSHRVPEATPGTEVGDLGLALNAMLEQIETSFDDQRRSEERLRQFVADASHELRTPVATIRGYAELYRDGGLDDPAQLDDAMRRSEQESIRMGTLVDDLLLLARLDQGRPLAMGTVHLDALARDAVADARARNPQRTIELQGADRDVAVAGDEGRLRQVVTNLVANAVVHTPATADVRVTVAPADATGAGGRITVADRGAGMPAEVAERVFERFYRADPMRFRSRGGSGLGLSIAKAIVEAHGGTIAVDSSPGSGSTFTVTLPAPLPAPSTPR